jgi:DNA-binding LacI/PurR family transcriptional regulator
VRVTLKHIAADVGVSPMTVSNAFNRPDQLSAGLRERILTRARELGYSPDPLARGLRRGRAGAVGLVSDTPLSYAFDDPAASAVMAGLCSVTEDRGLGLVLVPTGGHLPSTAVDGVVVYSVGERDPLLAATRRLPTVIIDQPRDTGLPTVGIDDRAAAYDAARHLTALGHRRFGVVTFGLGADDRVGPADLARRRGSSYAVSRHRLAGYEAALTEAGVDWATTPVLECAGSVRERGREAAELLLGGAARPTAVLATSDVLALGVLDAAPKLAVVGFDDIPEAAAAGLTTIRQDHRAKGRAAGELLLSENARPVTLPYELIVRASSASSG